MNNNWKTPVFLGIAIILGFGGVMYSNYQKNMTAYSAAAAEVEVSKSAKAEKRKEIEDREKYGWRTIEVDPPVYGKAPHIPDIPPVVIDRRGQPDPSMRLKYLLKNHPEDEISQTMFNLVRSFELSIGFQTQDKNIAEFSYRSLSEIVAQDHQDTRENFPYFTFNSGYLLRMATKDDVLLTMLVVHHEFVHYQDWEQSSPKEKFSFMPRKNNEMSEKECKESWLREYGAYESECILSNHWGGIQPLRKLCDSVHHEAAFKQSLFFFRIELPSSKKVPQCHRVWAELAGAPNPDLFIPER